MGVDRIVVFNRKKGGCPKHFVEDCSYLAPPRDKQNWFEVTRSRDILGKAWFSYGAGLPAI